MLYTGHGLGVVDYLSGTNTAPVITALVTASAAKETMECLNESIQVSRWKPMSSARAAI
jgi:hypothetical protein